jgi:alginate O-acetyltransferase complex protein AlgI
LMLFSSYDFLFLFLPPVLIGFYMIGRFAGAIAAFYWLLLSSFVFYAWWSPRFLLLLLISCTVNATFGVLLAKPDVAAPVRKIVMIAGVAFNLAVLGYFKYAGFLVANFEAATGYHVNLGSIILPLGISFFVFQKIALIVDAYRGEVRHFSVRRFFLFVFFFPQLIAGPIVHHREIMPQLNERLGTQMDWALIAPGLTIFLIGLFKKTVIADSIAPYATTVFSAAAKGAQVPLIESWVGTIAYSLQLYFDFSGYSDMAVGLGLLFGLRLPINFASPYKASSLIEFWRCWHITLSRFLRDYLYIPLGGGRFGTPRRLVNILVVMLLGGLWHGAGWTFLLWGAIHGFGLVINHVFRLLHGAHETTHKWAGRIVTFCFVSLAWIPFRSADLETTLRMFRGVFGFNGVILPDTYLPRLGGLGQWLAAHGVAFQSGDLFQGVHEAAWLAVLVAVVWLLPNVPEWIEYAPFEARTPRRSTFFPPWRPRLYWSAGLAVCGWIALMFVGRGGEFLYFQF